MLALLYLAALLIISPLVAVLSLYFAARMFHAPYLSVGRVVLLTFLLGVAAIACQAVLVLNDSAETAPGLLVQVAGMGVLGIAANRQVLGLSWLHSGLAWLMSTGLSIALTVAILLPLRTYAIEAFVSPTNSMAPAILGPHFAAVCPHCGGQAVATGTNRPSTAAWQAFAEPEEAICTACRRTSQAAIGAEAKVAPADRFVVDKTLAPQRWDLLVYRSSHNEGQLQVHRLVGLPGESLELKNGELWIDGQAAAYSLDMVGLLYEGAQFSDRPKYALSEGQVVTLGADEYFVLGDFSSGSRDSRYDGPLAGKDLVGVITLLYWPPPRWRVIR